MGEVEHDYPDRDAVVKKVQGDRRQATAARIQTPDSGYRGRAGNTTSVVVNGTYFGANPSVAISLQNQDTNCNGSCVGLPFNITKSNTQVTFNVTIGANEVGNVANVVVTSAGYDNNPPGFLGPQPQTDTSVNIQIIPIAATIPVISYFGNTASQNQQVYVGQEIALSAGGIVVPNGLSIISTTWTIQGTAIASYAASTTSGQVTALPNPITGTVVTFYWTNASAASGCSQSPLCSVTFTYQLSNLQPASATAAFNVGSPTNVSVAATPSVVIVFNPPNNLNPNYRDVPLLVNGGAGAPGMEFLATSTLPPGDQGLYQWVQLISSDETQYLTATGPGPASNSIPGLPELDITYPYGADCPPLCTVTTTNVTDDTAQDSPASPLSYGQGEYTRSFYATMYLEWSPSPDAACSALYAPCTIEAPLGSTSWHWSGDAINTLNSQRDVNGVWYDVWETNSQNPSCSNPHCSIAYPFQAGGGLPQWGAALP